MNMNNVSEEYFYDDTYIQNMEEPESIRHIAMGILGALSISGTIGNALVLYVFSHQKQKPSSTIFILTLAATDFITSAVTMPYTIVCEVLNFDIEYDILCKLYHFLVTTTIPFSAFVMVAIAVDRYLSIVHPFKHMMTKKRALITVFVMCFCAVVIGLVSCLMYGVYKRYTVEDMQYIAIIAPQHSLDNPANYIQYMGRCTRNSVIFNDYFFQVYQKVYSSFFAICAVIVIALYIVIYRSVLTRRRRRLHLSNSCSVNCYMFLALTDTVEQSALTTGRDKSTTGNTKESLRSESSKKKYHRKELQPTSEACNIVARERTGFEENDSLVRTSGVSKAKLDKLRMANIKTALMLSVVALTYIVTFAPAWLMALKVIPMNAVVFYLYFTYNVANPIIYAFLNKSFRVHLTKLFKMR